MCRPAEWPGAPALTTKDGTRPVIFLARPNGDQIALNADLIERAEATPGTLLTLVDGTEYLVTESVQEVIDRVRLFRASGLVAAKGLEGGTGRARAVLRALSGPGGC
jgi:flagellar protein FlbD